MKSPFCGINPYSSDFYGDLNPAYFMGNPHIPGKNLLKSYRFPSIIGGIFFAPRDVLQEQFLFGRVADLVGSLAEHVLFFELIKYVFFGDETW